PAEKFPSRQLTPLGHCRILSPPGGTSGFDTYQDSGAPWSMALKPPSPPFTLTQLVLVVADEVAGEPLSCAPPSSVSTSDGCWEKLTNCVIDPRFWLRSSNAFAAVQDPEFGAVKLKPFRAR